MDAARLAAAEGQPSVWRVTRLSTFQALVVREPGGHLILVAIMPSGEAYELPFGPDAAVTVGRALSAPSVAMPDTK